MSWVLQAGKVDYNASDFDNDAARQEKATSGEELVRLTNWVSGNTNRPQIQAGSKIVVNNTLFYTDSDTVLVDDPGGLVDGDVFIRFEKSGVDPAFTLIAYLTNDDPRSVAEFDAAKGGWYEPATNIKYSDIIMEVSGVLTSFDKKGNQDIDNGNKKWIDSDVEIVGDINILGSITPASVLVPDYGAIGSMTIAGSSSWNFSTQYLPNTTVAGSTLIRSNVNDSFGSPLSGQAIGFLGVVLASSTNLGLVGTWRLLTRVYVGTSVYPLGLFQRIS